MTRLKLANTSFLSGVRGIVAGVALLIPFCLNACRASENVDRSKDVTFNGPINPTTAADLIRRSDRSTERLIITSMGGEIESAIRIGRFVRKNKLIVIVRGYCLSGCAHFIFMPAIEKSVEDSSIVGFHGTATARLALFNMSGRGDLAKDYSNLSSLETSFYQNSGIRAELLVNPLAKISPVCYLVGSSSMPLPSGKSALLTRSSFYVPTRQALRKMGSGEIKGFWPESQAEFVAASSKLPQNARLTFRFDGGERNSADSLQPVKECSANHP